MVSQTLTVATRASPLARAQTEEAIKLLRRILPRETRFKVIAMESAGDRDLKTPLTDPSIPDDFFTRDLDDMMRSGKADLAVHSAKDLPQKMARGLTVAALLPALDIRDALVARKGLVRTWRGELHEPMSASRSSALHKQIKTIGTSSPRREVEIRRLYPRARLVALRGTVNQRIQKLDAGEYDAIIVAACALHRLSLSSRISSFLPYDPAPQQGRLAIVTRADNASLTAAVSKLDVRRRAGMVALVGCPADFALLPVRAAQYIKQADVIFHDRLLPDEMLLQIVSKAVPVGKAGGQASTPQSEIHRLMLAEAEKGKLVVRLHGGDPSIYGHLSEELDFLNAWKIRADVVPAVTAMQLAAAQARAPLTHRGEGHRVTLISARPTPGVDVGSLPGPEVGNLAVYMGVAEMKTIEGKLRAAGWLDTTSIIVGERLGYRDQRVRSTTLKNWRRLQISSPAVFLVGPKSYFTDDATLFVGTDPEHFLKHGPLIHFPLIRLVSHPLKDRVAILKKQLPRVKGILFPSRFAVHSLVEALMQAGDVRALAGKTLLAVGPATEEELKNYGLRAEGAADNLGGVQTLIKKLKRTFAGRYLYPCSDAAPQRARIAALKSHGIQLVPGIFYANREVPYAALPRQPFARVLFTSTSTVTTYFKRYPAELKANRTWLAVGPSTLKALNGLGLIAETIED